jgi:hypothetical protein
MFMGVWAPLPVLTENKSKGTAAFKTDSFWNKSERFM